jgi:ABC-2 type transport system permease protein
MAAVWAVIVKEFLELRRDRRSMAMVIALPILLLVVFGYAANFNIDHIKTEVVGPGAVAASKALPPQS